MAEDPNKGESPYESIIDDNGLVRVDPGADLFIPPDQTAAPKPNQGQGVIIYTNPFFKGAQEDTAVVDKVLMSDGQRDLCLVTLDGNGVQVERWIKKDAAGV